MKIVNIDLTVPRYPCIECDIEVPELATHLQNEHHYAFEHAEFEFSKQSRLRICKSEHRGKHLLLPCEVVIFEIQKCSQNFAKFSQKRETDIYFLMFLRPYFGVVEVKKV